MFLLYVNVKDEEVINTKYKLCAHKLLQSIQMIYTRKFDVKKYL